MKVAGRTGVRGRGVDRAAGWVERRRRPPRRARRRAPTVAGGGGAEPTAGGGSCGGRRELWREAGAVAGGGRRELWREAGERDRRRGAAAGGKGAGSTADRSRLSGGTVADGGGSAPYRGEGGAGQQVVQEAVRRNQVRAAGALLLPPCHDLAPSRRRPAG